MRAALIFTAPLVLSMFAAPSATAAQPADQPDLVVEIRLDTHQLSDAIPAYSQADDVYLPLCEVARLLTLAIRCQGEPPRANGYILTEQRTFHFDAASREVTVDGNRTTLSPSEVLVKLDDIYIASRVLARWLPVDLALDMPNLTVRVAPREKLPLQARLDREAKGQTGKRASTTSGAPGFALVDTPYRLADAPFVDQTLSLDLRPGASAAAYTAYASADLLGMEAALYVARASRDTRPATRLTLGRHDPGAGLLGPLRARTAVIGSITAPSIAHIAHGSADGIGATVSNRPLSQAQLFDTHSLRGDLAPGWDVELYYNDALVGFQQSRADGKYSFADLPLHYGANEFRLVFYGPLGQLRVERHSFLLEDAPMAPGELHYHVTRQHAGSGQHVGPHAGNQRTVASVDYGLTRHLAANATLVHLRRDGREQRFASIGVNGYWQALIASATVIRDADGGRLAHLALRTRIGGMAVGASRALTDGFVSDLYLGGANPIKVRDEIRLDGAFGRMQIAAHARREARRQAGPHSENRELSLRLSTYRAGTAVSNAVRWQSAYGSSHADGALQASRRVAGIGLSGQMLYQVKPHAALSALALSADKLLWPGYQLNLNVARTFANPEYRFAAALNKNLGRFGMGVGAFRTSGGDFGASVQLFTALGREPRRALWTADAAPLAASGAASLLVFLDRNRNGVMDGADEPVSGAAFSVNGNSHLARTDAAGIATLQRLQPNQYLDIAVDATSLEDPQWQPNSPGMRIVPRAGKVSQLDFAIGITGEIDGTAYLLDKGRKRPIGGVELELVDEQGRVAGTATSSSDGYYVITAVAPGRYRLQANPAQLTRLGMGVASDHPASHALTMAADGTFINGKDVVIATLQVTAAARQAGAHPPGQ